jgi:hypothetical protein
MYALMRNGAESRETDRLPGEDEMPNKTDVSNITGRGSAQAPRPSSGRARVARGQLYRRL